MVETLARRTVGEWALHAKKTYAEPFLDVQVTGHFTSPSWETFTIPGFYDGDSTWRVRFNPGEVGTWHVRLESKPADPGLSYEGEFTVTASDQRGFLKSTPGAGWGLSYESGDPVFLFGDTTYNLFGAAHCDLDVKNFLQRRAEQGFNLLRVRLAVSRFHGEEGYNYWQDRSTWPWAGSEQAPQFERFNLDWFRTVDRVVRLAEELGIGFEMIMQAWGFEFPFNSRNIFTAEWEQHWLRYLIARYDAFNCVYCWTLMNEYEYYPDGHMYVSSVANQWAMRIARYVKSTSAHGHIIALHNGPQNPTFAERFAADIDAIDLWMYQDWGSLDEHDAWLTPGLDKNIRHHAESWPGSFVLSEYGYERNPDLPRTLWIFDYTDTEHNRRGAWRGIFAGVGIITGFENSWGPHQILDQDQPGMAHMLHAYRFITQIIDFAQYQPDSDIVQLTGDEPSGYEPIALATADRSKFAVYLPAGGSVTLTSPGNARWFDPRTGETQPATAQDDTFTAPAGGDRPWDWVLFS